MKARPTIESGAKARKAGVRRRATILWLEAATRAAEQLHYMHPKKDSVCCAHIFKWV